MHTLSDKDFKLKFPNAFYPSLDKAKVIDGNKIYFWEWDGKHWWNIEERTTFK